jgi:crotonobetaine/carnitine-CoA ligase
MRTIGDLLADAAGRHGDATYLISDGESFSFDATDRRANGAADDLQALGVARGRRVAALLENDARFLFAWFGIARLGAALLPMNPRSTPAETAGLIARSAPALLLFDDSSEALARAVVEETGVTTVPVKDVTSAERIERPPASVSPDDVVVFLSTSGTSGTSKLVMQTHGAMVLAGEGFPWWLGLDASDRLLTSLPLFHLNALAYSTLGALEAGASLVVLRRFSASRFLDEARAYEATEFNAVGAMLEILMRGEARRDDATGSLRVCYTTPAPSSRERHLEIERRFGFRVMAGYGLSETPYGTIWPRAGQPPYGSMGALKQHPTLGAVNEARVVDEDGGDVEPGRAGELLLRNPAVMSGYFDMPEETARALRGGWLHTGDVVRVEDGSYYFVGRKKEIVRRRGENVSPAEIEEVLSSHEDVEEAAVVGVPSELEEEDLKAFLVVAREPDLSALRDWVRARLSRHKVPRYVEVVDDFPRTPTGRIAKHLLTRDRTAGEVPFA